MNSKGHFVEAAGIFLLCISKPVNFFFFCTTGAIFTIRLVVVSPLYLRKCLKENTLLNGKGT